MLPCLPDIFFQISEQNPKYYMLGPFGVGGFSYATDGHVIVRARFEYEPAKNAPPVQNLIWDRLAYEKFGIPLVLPDKATIFCDCRSGGFCKANHNCGDCGGSGVILDEFCRCPHGSIFISSKVVSVLLRHGVKDIFPQKNQPDKFRPCYFQGPGFDGILISLNDTEDDPE